MNKIYLLTGLSGSGKTTIAREIQRRTNAEIVDGDDMRDKVSNKDFSWIGRKNNMMNAAYLAYRLSKYNNVVISLINPVDKARKEIKKMYPNVIEVFIKCSLRECRDRDVKGLYSKAIKGKIKNFTGIDSPYEVPYNADMIINTELLSVKQCVDSILCNNKQKIYSLFIGRWQCLPPHGGHQMLFQKVLDEGKNVLVAFRNTKTDEKNPYSIKERMNSFKKVYSKEIEEGRMKLIEIDDIEDICYGREVGWGIREIKLDEDTEKISATAIREGLKNEKKIKTSNIEKLTEYEKVLIEGHILYGQHIYQINSKKCCYCSFEAKSNKNSKKVKNKKGEK